MGFFFFFLQPVLNKKIYQMTHSFLQKAIFGIYLMIKYSQIRTEKESQIFSQAFIQHKIDSHWNQKDRTSHQRHGCHKSPFVIKTPVSSSHLFPFPFVQLWTPFSTFQLQPFSNGTLSPHLLSFSSSSRRTYRQHSTVAIFVPN